jgi:hypothetical protein
VIQKVKGFKTSSELVAKIKELFPEVVIDVGKD